MRIQTILNQVKKVKSFVYREASWETRRWLGAGRRAGITQERSSVLLGLRASWSGV
jgi:hypothetical protein